MGINEQEAKLAKANGAQVVKNSGRGLNKGDAKTDTLLIDYKFTDKKSFSLNIEAFRKHELDAVRVQRQPVIVAVFQEHKKRQIAMVDWSYLLELEAIAAEFNNGHS